MLLETLPVAFTGPNVAALPKVTRIDPLLPQAGALALYEPGHPLATYTGPLTHNAMALDNLAIAQAKSLIPAGNEVTLNGSIYFGTEYTGVNGAVERTAKKGLHFMSAQNAGTVGTNLRFGLLYGGNDILKFLNANTAHAFYVSIWGKTTRDFKSNLAAGSSVPNRSTIVSADNFGMYGFYRRPAVGTVAVSVYPQDAAKLGLRDEGAQGQLTGTFQNIARAPGFAAPAHTPAVNFKVFRNGNDGLSSGDYGKSESHIFYRYYIEDLTVSGRTYAQVDAIDYAEYVKQVKTVGGRYYGDTYSDPATVTP